MARLYNWDKKQNEMADKLKQGDKRISSVTRTGHNNVFASSGVDA
jgi:hypothetical protein